MEWATSINRLKMIARFFFRDQWSIIFVINCTIRSGMRLQEGV